jgi:hypothetical protein
MPSAHYHTHRMYTHSGHASTIGVWLLIPLSLALARRCGVFATSGATPSKSLPSARASIGTMSAEWSGGERNVALENIVKLAKALAVLPKDLFVDFP